MEIKDIEIMKIKQAGNIRQRTDDGEIFNLMSSIRQDGLLEPIGLQQVQGKDEYVIIYGNRRLEACTKLGWKTIPAIINNSGKNIELKELIVQNTVENIQREDVNAVELGRTFLILSKDHKMSNSEIASRFAISVKKVRNSLKFFEAAPDEYKNKIKFITQGTSKKGFISVASANQILQLRKFIGTDNVTKLFDVAKQDGFTSENIRIVSVLLMMNYSVDEAIELAKEYKFYNVKIPVKPQEINTLCKKYKRTKNKLVTDILRGSLDVKLDIPIWKEMKKPIENKEHVLVDMPISNGSMPLTDSGAIIKDKADDRLKLNWGKFKLK